MADGGGGGVSIGTLTGGVSITSNAQVVIDDLCARLKTAESAIISLSSKTKTENDKIQSAYSRLAASLDPVVAGQQKLTTAHTTLSAALSKGLITQQQHNDLLDKAKSKYASTGSSLSNFSSLVSKLEEVTGLFGYKAQEMAAGLSSITNQGSRAGESLASFGAAMPVLLGVAAAVAVLAIGFEGLKFGAEFLADVTREGMKTQTIVTELEQSLKSNGSAAGFSSAQLIQMADSMSVATGKSKDLILQGLTIETRFGALNHETFPTFARLALDLAQKTGDIPGAFEKVSIAVAGGGKGLMAFKDIGVALTSQQKAMMKSLHDHGQEMEYQRYVAGLLEKGIGGLANAYGETLQGKIGRVTNEFRLGKEIIANQLIPAFDDLMNDVIRSFGGWERFHQIVQMTALDLGQAFRGAVYTIRIDLDTIGEAIDRWKIKTSQSVVDVFKSIAGAIETASKLLPPVGGKNPVLDSINSQIKETERNIQVYSISLAENQNAIVRTRREYENFKPALEGVSTVYAKHAAILPDIAAKTKQLKDGIEAATHALENQTAAFNAMKLKLTDEIDDRSRLIVAMGKSEEAYKLEVAAIAAEKQVRADFAALLKTHESAIQAANKAIDESTKNFGTNSVEVKKANKILDDINATYAKEVTSLGQLEEANKRSADTFKHAEINVTDFRKALVEANKYIEIQIKQSLELQRANASLADEQSRIDLTLGYGSSVADLAVKLGAASEATREYNIEAELSAAIKAHDGILNEQEVADMRAEIAARLDTISAIKQQQVALQIKADVWKPLLDGFQPTSAIILDGIRSWAEGGNVTAESIAKSLVDWLLQAFEKILQNWIQLQITMAAVQRSYQASYGVFNTGTTALDTASGIGSAAGGASGSSVGSMAGWALAAYGLFVAWKALSNDTKNWSGEATIAIGGATAELRSTGSYAQQAGIAISDLIKSVNDLAKQWHLGLSNLTAGSVSISLDSQGNVVVKTLIDTMGKIFKSMADAVDYAKVQALKYATFSSDTDALIRAAIAKSSATTTAGLQADIDFATRLATQNLPQIAQSMHSALQSMIDDFQHALDLFGPNGPLRSLTDFAQLGPATASVLTAFTTSLQGFYDQLTGHKQDAAQLAEQQRIAYNAQRAIMIAQITLLYEEIKARIADYQAQLLARQNFGNRTGGGGPDGTSDGTTPTGGPTAGIAAKGGGILIVDVRNPTGDAQLAALLQVLDNLARALTGLPPEIAPGGVKLPSGGGAHGGVSNRQSIAGDIAASNLKLQNDAYLTSLAAINKQWDDDAKKAGKNKQLLAEITAQREKEIAALQAQLALKVSTDIASYATQGDNSELAQQLANKKQADDLRKEIVQAGADLHQSAAVIATNLAAIDAAEKKHAQQIAQSAIASLGLPIESTWEGIQKLADTLAGLNQDVSNGTITLAQFNSVWAQQVNQSKLTLLGLAETIAQSSGDAAKAAEIKSKMDEINFDIQVAQFNILLTQYEALGLISGQNEADMEALRAWINQQHPDFNATTATVATAQTATTLSTASTTFATAVQQFKTATDTLLKAYQSLFGGTNTLGGSAQDRLSVAQSQFKSVESLALSGDVTARADFGAAAQNYLQVLNEANAGGALFGAERDRLRQEFELLLSQTRFTVDGVTYDSGLGAPVAPTIIPTLAGGTGGSPTIPSVPSVDGSTGTSTATDTTGLLTQILTAVMSNNANQGPVLATIANNTGQERDRIGRLADTMDRLVVELRQIAQAA